MRRPDPVEGVWDLLVVDTNLLEGGAVAVVAAVMIRRRIGVAVGVAVVPN